MDGVPVTVATGDTVALAVSGPAAPRPRRHAVPGRRLRQLRGRGGRRRLGPDLPDAGPGGNRRAPSPSRRPAACARRRRTRRRPVPCTSTPSLVVVGAGASGLEAAAGAAGTRSSSTPPAARRSSPSTRPDARRPADRGRRRRRARPSARRRGGPRHRCRGASSRLPGQPAAGPVHGERRARGLPGRRRPARRGGHRRTTGRRAVPDRVRAAAAVRGRERVGDRGRRRGAKEPTTKGSSARTPAGPSSSVSAPRPATSWPAWPPDVPVTVVGPAAAEHPLPAPPSDGVVCPCSGTTVEDLEAVWSRGFTELELVKRASLCGTGTCQGSRVPAPPAGVRGRPLAAAGRAVHRPPGRPPAHPRRGRRRLPPRCLPPHCAARRARPPRRPAWTASAAGGGPGRTATCAWSTGRCATPSASATCPRSGRWWCPARTWSRPSSACTRATSTTSRPGRSRYALVLNERGHLIDDGMICRDGDTRFTLTFTSGGAAAAEMWVRDWIETWGLRVHVLDRTMSLGAINVTGPRAAELLGRLGLPDPPRFLRHEHRTVAGVDCHVMRLSFTGEASFELHHPLDASVTLWRALLDAGADLGVQAPRAPGAVRAALGEGPRHRGPGHRARQLASPCGHGLGGEDGQARLPRPASPRAHRPAPRRPPPPRLHHARPGATGGQRHPRRRVRRGSGDLELRLAHARTGRACSAGSGGGRSRPRWRSTAAAPWSRPRRSSIPRVPVRGPERLHAWRVVAEPGAVDALEMLGARIVLRIAPDDALVLDDAEPAVRRSGRHRRDRERLRRLGARAGRGRRAGPRSRRVGAADGPAGRPIQPGSGSRRAGPGQALAAGGRHRRS